MKFTISYICLIILSLFLYRCANVTQPTGGPKDTIPPSMIETLPVSQSLNFKEDKILLVFDEYIKVQNLKTGLIITPTFDDYDYKINKNTLTINLNEPLLENTTYTLNFTDAIEDITESNAALGTILSFSTGPYIDSVGLQGNVFSLMKKEPKEKAIVALYDATDTLNVFDDKPLYFTITDTEGNFRFQNLKNIKYKIYAFLDGNNNLTLQTSSEPYGFLAKQISSNDDTINLELPIQFRDVTELEIRRMRKTGRYFQIAANKPLRGYSVRPKQKGYRLRYSIDKEAKNITVFKPNNLDYADSLEVDIVLGDSLGTRIDTTTYIAFGESKRKPSELKITKENITYDQKQKVVATEIKFSKPLRRAVHDSITIQIDTLKTIGVPPSALKFNGQKTILTINFPISLKDSIPTPVDTTTNKEPGTNVPQLSGRLEGNTVSTSNIALVFGKSAFLGIENDTSKAFKIPITIPDANATGIVKGKVKTDYQSYIIQLLNQQYEVVKEVKDAEEYQFDYLPPGTYTIRVLIDDNNNGFWIQGNILKNREPESVYISPTDIIIKSNWELENDLIEF